MSILSWLRRLVADFFYADRDELEVATGDVQRELDAAKAVAVLAVAEAQRGELELREALKSRDTSEAKLRALVAQLEELRRRARQQVVSFRERQARTADALSKMGELKRAAEINEEREHLREYVARAEASVDETALEDLEADVRSEAARLDVLERLERGVAETRTPEPMAAVGPGIKARARALLADDAYGDIWEDG